VLIDRAPLREQQSLAIKIGVGVDEGHAVIRWASLVPRPDRLHHGPVRLGRADPDRETLGQRHEPVAEFAVHHDGDRTVLSFHAPSCPPQRPK